MEPAVALEASAKAVQYTALLPAIGASAVRWWLLPRAAGELPAREASRLESALAKAGLAAAVVVFGATVIRAWTHTVSALGFAASVSRDALRVVAIESRWGVAWRPQVIAAGALVVAFAWTRARPSSGWPLTGIATVGLCVSLPLLGHAAGHPARVAFHAAHAFGAGTWLGTLAVVVTVTRDTDIRLALLRTFSPIALTGAVTVAGAGLAMSWWYLGALSNLWATAYGEILALKVCVVCGAWTCGYVNWQSLRHVTAPPTRWQSVVATEVALAVVVVAVTGVLTEIGHP